MTTRGPGWQGHFLLLCLMLLVPFSLSEGNTLFQDGAVSDSEFCTPGGQGCPSVLEDLEQSAACEAEDFGYGSIVCACNATYCDVVDAIGDPGAGHFLVYTTSKSGHRLRKQQGSLGGQRPGGAFVFVLDRDRARQDILGFGGSFTDSAGININALTPGGKRNLMRSYFSQDGIGYSLARVPIGGADFSARGYTYLESDREDLNLTGFKLAPEDLEYKIPLITEARELTDGVLRLMASPWSPPAWMKTSGKLTGGQGRIKGQPGGPYYKAYANYIVKFLEEYTKHNVTFWGLTAQNEPLFGNFDEFIQVINNVLFSAADLREFIAQDLGPALQESGLDGVHLMAFDDMVLFMPFYLNAVLANSSDVHRFVSGIAFHFYFNRLIDFGILDKVHRDYPDLFLLSTEACEGIKVRPTVHLGSWDRAEIYAVDVMQDLLHWTGGWIDWNLALDLNGGPNWVNNPVDSPVIVDAQKDVFYKQPMFYILAHYSKFLPPGSKVVSLNAACEDKDKNLMAVAAVTPTNTTVVIVLNRSDRPRTFSIEESTTASILIGQTIPARSIQTYLWKESG